MDWRSFRAQPREEGKFPGGGLSRELLKRLKESYCPMIAMTAEDAALGY